MLEKEPDTYYLFLKDFGSSSSSKIDPKKDTLIRFDLIGPSLYVAERWDRKNETWVPYIRGLFKRSSIPAAAFNI